MIPGLIAKYIFSCQTSQPCKCSVWENNYCKVAALKSRHCILFLVDMLTLQVVDIESMKYILRYNGMFFIVETP